MRRIQLKSELRVEEIEQHYRNARDGVSRSQWQIIWLLAQGKRSEEIEAISGYSVKWIRILAGRYNREGAEGIGDKRAGHSGRKAELRVKQQIRLKALVVAAAERHENWNGRRVAAWLSEELGHPVHVQRGYEWLRKLGFSPQVGRRQHVRANKEAQKAFKKRSR